jgi:hypothetical protein
MPTTEQGTGLHKGILVLGLIALVATVLGVDWSSLDKGNKSPKTTPATNAPYVTRDPIKESEGTEPILIKVTVTPIYPVHTVTFTIDGLLGGAVNSDTLHKRTEKTYPTQRGRRVLVSVMRKMEGEVHCQIERMDTGEKVSNTARGLKTVFCVMRIV